MLAAPIEAQTFSLTAYCVNRRKIFADATAAELMVSVIRDNHQLDRMLVHAFAVMPDHVHVLLTLMPGVPLERAMQFLKGRFTMLSMSRGSVWDRIDRKYPVASAGSFETIRRELEQNPVRAGMVPAPEEYAYSSAAASAAGWLAPMPAYLDDVSFVPMPKAQPSGLV